MDKQKIKSEVMSVIKKMADNVKAEKHCKKVGESEISETDTISALGFESLELIALVDVLMRKFNVGYLDINTLQSLTVGELCEKVTVSQVRAEVKKELLRILHAMEPDDDYSGADAEDQTLWDWGFDSMDIEDLACEAEARLNINLNGSQFAKSTFGEIIDSIAAKVR